MKEWDSQLATHSDKKFSCFTTFKQYFGQEKILKIIKKIEHAGVVLHVFAYLPTDNIERGRYVGIL